MPWWSGPRRPRVDKSVDKVDKTAISRIFEQSGPILAVFAKEPVPGTVKTRLSPPLSAVQACWLYRIALEETVSRLRAEGFAVVVCYAGRRAWFADAFPGVPLLAQVEGELGGRLRAAADELFACGGAPVLFVGSDSPDLPVALVRQALEALQRCPAAVIPCVDGGYALIGLQRPLPGLFAEIPWSTPQVLSTTRERAAALGFALYETEAWEDLDDINALRRLMQRSPDARTALCARTELGITP